MKWRQCRALQQQVADWWAGQLRKRNAHPAQCMQHCRHEQDHHRPLLIHPFPPTPPGPAPAGLACSAASTLLLAGCSEASASDPLRVDLQEGRQLFEAKKVLMYDIREPQEHATGVANGARLLPMSQLNKRVNEIPKDPAQPVLIICNTQNRSSKVVQAMREAGWTNVRYVHGGMSTWAKNGWPMIKPFGLPAS